MGFTRNYFQYCRLWLLHPPVSGVASASGEKDLRACFLLERDLEPEGFMRMFSSTGGNLASSTRPRTALALAIRRSHPLRGSMGTTPFVRICFRGLRDSWYKFKGNEHSRRLARLFGSVINSTVEPAQFHLHVYQKLYNQGKWQLRRTPHGVLLEIAHSEYICFWCVIGCEILAYGNIGQRVRCYTILRSTVRSGYVFLRITISRESEPSWFS